MSDRDNSNSDEKQLVVFPWFTTILLNSLKIISRDKNTFLLIFAFIAFPLSLFHFSLSLTSRPLKEHIYHLEALASISHTRFESRQVWHESREDAVALLRYKFLFFVPILFLSLTVTTVSITSASLSYNNRPLSILTAISAARTTWKRVLVTSVVIYAFLLMFTQMTSFLAAIFTTQPILRYMITLIGLGFDIYLMAAMGLAITIASLEEKYGLDAIFLGFNLLNGRRMCVWVLSCFFVMLSGYIGYRMDASVKGQDLSASPWWAIVLGGWDRVGLVCLYGAEVVLSYVVTTVFYCECRKRQAIRSEDDSNVVDV